MALAAVLGHGPVAGRKQRTARCGIPLILHNTTQYYTIKYSTIRHLVHSILHKYNVILPNAAYLNITSILLSTLQILHNTTWSNATQYYIWFTQYYISIMYYYSILHFLNIASILLNTLQILHQYYIDFSILPPYYCNTTSILILHKAIQHYSILPKQLFNTTPIQHALFGLQYYSMLPLLLKFNTTKPSILPNTTNTTRIARGNLQMFAGKGQHGVGQGPAWVVGAVACALFRGVGSRMVWELLPVPFSGV